MYIVPVLSIAGSTTTGTVLRLVLRLPVVLPVRYSVPGTGTAVPVLRGSIT